MDNHVRMVPKQYDVGTIVHTEVVLELSWDESVERDGLVSTEHRRRSARQSKDETVLERNDLSILRLAVSYRLDTEVLVRDNGGVFPFESPLSTHDYHVVALPTGMKVEKAGGAAMSSDEITWIERDQAGIGKPDPWFAGLPSTELQVGTSVSSLAAPIIGELGHRVGGGGPYRPTPCKTEVVVRGFKPAGPGRAAVFDVRLIDEATAAKSPVQWDTPRIDLAGELVLLAPSGWVSELHLMGNISHGVATMEGRRAKSGTVDLKVTRSYL